MQFRNDVKHWLVITYSWRLEDAKDWVKANSGEIYEMRAKGWTTQRVAEVINEINVKGKVC